MSRNKKKPFVWLEYRSLSRAVAAGVALIAMFIVLNVQETPSSRTWSSWALPLSGKTIAIDAGHGGVDGGAASKQGLVEKDLNLAVALQLRDYLQQAGAIVVMTREGDYDLAQEGTKAYSRRKTEDLLERVRVIEASKPDIVVSIHMNSVPSPKWSGAQTFYYPGAEESANLAAHIQQEIKRNLSNTNREANTVGTMYLLKKMQVPAVLVEVGFLSNPAEASNLGNGEYQRKVAASIYQGLLRFTAGEEDRRPDAS